MGNETSQPFEYEENDAEFKIEDFANDAHDDQLPEALLVDFYNEQDAVCNKKTSTVSCGERILISWQVAFVEPNL